METDPKSCFWLASLHFHQALAPKTPAQLKAPELPLWGETGACRRSLGVSPWHRSLCPAWASVFQWVTGVSSSWNHIRAVLWDSLDLPFMSLCRSLFFPLGSKRHKCTYVGCASCRLKDGLIYCTAYCLSVLGDVLVPAFTCTHEMTVGLCLTPNIIASSLQNHETVHRLPPGSGEQRDL